MALLIDASSGVLSGAAFAQGWQTAPWKLPVGARRGGVPARQEFLARMDAQLDQVKQGKRGFPGVDELLVPG
jgi:hypothetical protein